MIMRKVILQLAVSLDGYIEGPNGEYDWCFTDQDYGMSRFFQGIDSVLMGRKSYELVLKTGDAEMPGFDQLKQYVFSTTLAEVRPGAILIKDNVADEVNRIKGAEGKDIWLFGGAALTSSLLNLGLVDEMSLAVHPVLLGKGKSLCGELDKRVHLHLTGSKTYSSGLVMLNYDLIPQTH